MKDYVISVIVDNSHGVLTRICQLFNRRGYNFDSVTGGMTENENISRITLVGKAESSDELEQILKQINKLENVHKVMLLENNECICKEIMFLKVNADQSTRQNIMSIVEIFKGSIVDVSLGAIIIQVTGDEKKLNAFQDLMRPFGILEVVRSGFIAIGRGEVEVSQKSSDNLQVACGQ